MRKKRYLQVNDIEMRVLHGSLLRLKNALIRPALLLKSSESHLYSESGMMYNGRIEQTNRKFITLRIVEST